MKHLSEKIIARIKTDFTFLEPITSRSQFGGYGLLSNNVMFALVSEGELYLRANDNVEHLFIERNMPNLVYAKRGIPVLLRYYWVDPALWMNNETLINFVQLAYQGAVTEALNKKHKAIRLKDLPNLSIGIERLLWRVGIRNVSELRLKGAKSSYLQLRALKSSLGVNMLLALAGAINGYHHAVLPKILRHELLEWFEGIKEPIVSNH
ncbi:Regulator of competence-specific genes [Candidatus Regiella insecticola 5.15]|uniref:Regulator of competence-specific genes n=1 Tax=Candidatus Regiella insecticola 5.15 TaxID=1005043 RepID=G2GX19_9ENTR|nr:TfoX/Sxy family DNA transformation protein [Candidatus Regiella insecticola]EGY29707.1 Regulator of competence-specific genes [Candidatus Regiella insecticola 5.15]